MSVTPPRFQTLVPRILGGSSVDALAALEPMYVQAQALDDLVRATPMDDIVRDGPGLSVAGRKVFDRSDVDRRIDAVSGALDNSRGPFAAGDPAGQLRGLVGQAGRSLDDLAYARVLPRDVILRSYEELRAGSSGMVRDLTDAARALGTDARRTAIVRSTIAGSLGIGAVALAAERR